MTVPQAVNQCWSIDFVQDPLDDGRRFRILNVVDNFMRECLASVLDTSLSGVQVVRELDRLCSVHGRPAMISPVKPVLLQVHLQAAPPQHHGEPAIAEDERKND
jgi:transposase InsO family protein